MGWLCHGILFGAEFAGESLWTDEDGAPIFEEYDPSLQGHHRPDWTSFGDATVVGFWVAVGGSGWDGIPHLHSQVIDLSKIEEDETIKESYVRALKQWLPFEEWCAKRGILLGSPRFWLAPTETA